MAGPPSPGVPAPCCALAPRTLQSPVLTPHVAPRSSVNFNSSKKHGSRRHQLPTLPAARPRKCPSAPAPPAEVGAAPVPGHPPPRAECGLCPPPRLRRSPSHCPGVWGAPSLSCKHLVSGCSGTDRQESRSLVLVGLPRPGRAPPPPGRMLGAGPGGGEEAEPLSSVRGPVPAPLPSSGSGQAPASWLLLYKQTLTAPVLPGRPGHINSHVASPHSHPGNSQAVLRRN